MEKSYHYQTATIANIKLKYYTFIKRYVVIWGYFSSNFTVMTIHIFHIFTLYCTNQDTLGERIKLTLPITT